MEQAKALHLASDRTKITTNMKDMEQWGIFNFYKLF